MPSEPIKVLLVARHATVRAGLRYALSGSPDMEVMGEAASAADAAELLAEIPAGVVLADDSPLDRAGLLSIAEDAGRSIVLISEDPDAAASLAETSAFGWAALLPTADLAAIVGAVRAAASGLIAVDRGLHGLFQVLELAGGHCRAGALGRRSAADPAASVGLTPRETEVLQLLAAGLANKQIAARLGVSAHTIKFHVASVLSKLGAATRAEAVAIAARRGNLMV